MPPTSASRSRARPKPSPGDPALELIADEGLFAHREIFFNAARLDRSLALQAEDYRAIAQPRVARIAKR
jgi:Ala-tRNA(Pro) deacylase